MIIQYEITKDDWKSFMDWFYDKSRVVANRKSLLSELRHSKLLLCILSLFMIILISLALIGDWFAFILNAVLFLCIIFSPQRLYVEPIRTRMLRAKRELSLGKRQAEINDESISDKGSGNEFKYSWKRVSSWEPSDDFICIYCGFSSCIVIPKRNLNPGEYDSLTNILKDKKIPLSSIGKA